MSAPAYVTFPHFPTSFPLLLSFIGVANCSCLEHIWIGGLQNIFKRGSRVLVSRHTWTMLATLCESESLLWDDLQSKEGELTHTPVPMTDFYAQCPHTTLTCCFGLAGWWWCSKGKHASSLDLKNMANLNQVLLSSCETPWVIRRLFLVFKMMFTDTRHVVILCIFFSFDHVSLDLSWGG